MIERSQHLRLTLKAEQAGGTESERFGQHLRRHVALQFHVAGAVDLTLATGADGRICRRLPLLQSPATIAEKNKVVIGRLAAVRVSMANEPTPNFR